MAIADVPVNLIVGFLGVGKTTAIRHLLGGRPSGERWAVLVNEFGQIGVDGALLDEEGVAIREVAGGCLCCVASVALTAGLNRLLRDARPDRLLIEPSGLGHPARLIEQLTSEPYRRVLDLRATIGLLDARHLHDARYLDHPSFQDQIHLSDILVANKADRYDEADREAFLRLVRDIRPPKSKMAMIEHGRLEPGWLDWPRSAARRALFPEAHRFLEERSGLAADGQDPQRAPDPVSVGLPVKPGSRGGGWWFVEGAGEGYASGGWLLDGRMCLDADGFRELLAALVAERIKGVVHTTDGWLLVDRAEGEGRDEATRPRHESRLEIVHRTRLDWPDLDARLRGLVSGDELDVV